MGFYRDFTGGSLDPPSSGRRSPRRDDWHRHDNYRPRRKNYFEMLKVPVILLIVLGVFFYLANNGDATYNETIPKINNDFNKMVQDFFKNTFPPSEPIADKTKEVERLIFYYTNQERQKYGVSLLSWNDSLADIAREHSLDMATNNFFEHDNPRGEDPTARARRHGFPVEVQLSKNVTQVGIAENIGMMPTGNVQGICRVGSDADSVAYAHVKSWMESPGHRTNILDPSSHIIGVGVAYSDGYYYATQDFQ